MNTRRLVYGNEQIYFLQGGRRADQEQSRGGLVSGRNNISVVHQKAQILEPGLCQVPLPVGMCGIGQDLLEPDSSSLER